MKEIISKIAILKHTERSLKEEIYEQILEENNEDAESYWSIVLCQYGIEYVVDPASQKRIPTVNRMKNTSVFDDYNYKMAIKYADTSQKVLYETEAEAINNIGAKVVLERSKKVSLKTYFYDENKGVCLLETVIGVTKEEGTADRYTILHEKLYIRFHQNSYTIL